MVAPIYAVTAMADMPLFQLSPDPTISTATKTQSVSAYR
jgi:hypothetical protein